MPKNKSHSGASKRFKVTGSGKVLRERAGKRHLLEHKSSRVTRRLTGKPPRWPRATPRRSRSFSASETGRPAPDPPTPGPNRFRAV
ncbi:hypothetical protein GCM10023238_33210 [Streptomyces heliomycini]